MKLSASKKELSNLLALVERWEQQGYTPKIETDIALGRIRTLYELFISLGASSSEEQHTNDTPTETPAETPAENPTETPAENPAETPAETQKEESNCDPAIEIAEIEIAEIEIAEIETVEIEIIETQNSVTETTTVTITETETEAVVAEATQPEQNRAETTESQRESSTQESHCGGNFCDEVQKRRIIHELFCNDETFYNGEMVKLCAQETFEDLLIYIGQKYAWNPNSPVAQEFVAKMAARFNA